MKFLIGIEWIVTVVSVWFYDILTAARIGGVEKIIDDPGGSAVESTWAGLGGSYDRCFHGTWTFLQVSIQFCVWAPAIAGLVFSRLRLISAKLISQYHRRFYVHARAYNVAQQR